MIVTKKNLSECVDYVYHQDILKMILKDVDDINKNLEKMGHKDKQICLNYYSKDNTYNFTYKHNNGKISVNWELYTLDEISSITEFMKDFTDDFVEED